MFRRRLRYRHHKPLTPEEIHEHVLHMCSHGGCTCGDQIVWDLEGTDVHVIHPADDCPLGDQ